MCPLSAAAAAIGWWTPLWSTGLEVTGQARVSEGQGRCRRRIQQIHTLFQFWQTQTKNGIRWWRHLFKLQFWAFLILARKQKWHFWNPEVKLIQKYLFTKMPIRKIWPYVTRVWPEPSLSLICMVSDCKLASILEMYEQRDCKPCAASPENIFGDPRELSWPDLDLDTYLVWQVRVVKISV